MHKKLKMYGDVTIAEEYRKKKNKLTNLLRISEKKYYKQLLDNNKNNLSKLWKSLNVIISRNKKILNNTIFKHNNREITSNV